MAKQMGLSAHSALVDYELGRRIPPEDVLAAFEDALELARGTLQPLWRKALAERADRLCGALGRAEAQPVVDNTAAGLLEDAVGLVRRPLSAIGRVPLGGALWLVVEVVRRLTGR